MAVLQNTLSAVGAEDSIVAISSEGALFEYGSDDEIIRNLVALRNGVPGGTVMVGSLTRNDGLALLLNESNRIRIRLRGLDVFEDVIRRAGWTLERTIKGPLSINVRLGSQQGNGRVARASDRLLYTFRTV